MDNSDEPETVPNTGLQRLTAGIREMLNAQQPKETFAAPSMTRSVLSVPDRRERQEYILKYLRQDKTWNALQFFS
jgi:hypothetical protein